MDIIDIINPNSVKSDGIIYYFCGQLLLKAFCSK